MKDDKDTTQTDVHIDKSQVLQEAKQCFMATSAKTKKLVDVLTKCIYLILHGENLAPTEATDLFFHITRLFQYKDKDSTLRRLTYIGIKALSQQAENVYAVTSSLTTDANSSRDDPAIRASALRALCQTSDATTFTSFELYLKQSVNDRHPVVASAAIVSLAKIAQTNLDIVRRCTNEIQEALNSDSPMVQYHALGLSYSLCKGDKLATSKLISDCIQRGLESPLATCLLIKIITNYINDQAGEDFKYLSEYIVKKTKDPHKMISYESANAIIKMKAKADPKEIRLAVAQLRNFLSSSEASLRFAAVRTLNDLNSHPQSTWTSHQIGNVCKLHLLNKRYRVGDQITGLLDFSNSKFTCAKYSVILKCEDMEHCEYREEFSLGLEKDYFTLCPRLSLRNDSGDVLHCILSFLFYINGRDNLKTIHEDRTGIIELGVNDLDTDSFTCDFPIAIHAYSSDLYL